MVIGRRGFGVALVCGSDRFTQRCTYKGCGGVVPIAGCPGLKKACIIAGTAPYVSTSGVYGTGGTCSWATRTLTVVP